MRILAIYKGLWQTLLVVKESNLDATTLPTNLINLKNKGEKGLIPF